MQRGKQYIRRMILIMLLALVSFGSAGCDEKEFLARLSPEQRALYERYRNYYLGIPVTQAPPAAVAAAAPPSAPVAQQLPVQLSWEERLTADDTCPAFLDGPPRGLACLHCTQPEAQDQGRLISLMLFRSCLRNVAVNYLVDGTFGYDEAYLRDQIKVLSANGRRLFLQLYLSNGPAQRNRPYPAAGAFAVNLSPEEFRSAVLHDPAFQQAYQERVTRLIPLLQFAANQGAVLMLAPALEDNLSDKSFKKLSELTTEALPPTLPYLLVRNPCPNCYKGNGRKVPDGMLTELHVSSPFAVRVSDGIITNDGKDYRIAAEARGADELTLEDLAAVRDAAGERNNVFILWSGARQGLDAPTPSARAPFQAPAERRYAEPSFLERRSLIDFLREGLTVEPSPLP